MANIKSEFKEEGVITEIAIIGEVMIEMAPTGDDGFIRGVSGDVYNSACTLSGLGIKTALVTAIGAGAMADYVRRHAKGRNVKLIEPDMVSKHTPGLYIISNDEHGERYFDYWRGQSAAKAFLSDTKMFSEMLASLMKVPNIFLTGITYAVMSSDCRKHFVEFAKSYQGRLIFDPNYREQLWEGQDIAISAIKDLLPYVDIYLPGMEEEEHLFGYSNISDVASAVRGFKIQETIVKNGASSCYLITDSDIREMRISPSETVLDATGAGDHFNGGYLAAYLSGKSPSEAILIAAKVAAEVIQIRGGVLGMEQLKLMKDTIFH